MSCVFVHIFLQDPQIYNTTYAYGIGVYFWLARQCQLMHYIFFYKISKLTENVYMRAKTCDDDDDDDGENFYFERNKSKWTSLSRIFTTTKFYILPLSYVFKTFCTHITNDC